MSDQNFIKEINEEVRQDDLKNVWKKYRKFIISFIVLILFSVGSINFLDSLNEKKVKKQSELFFEAIEYIEQEDYENAQSLLKDINNSKIKGFSDLSYLYLIDLINKKKISTDLAKINLDKKSLFYDLIILQEFNNYLNSDYKNKPDIEEIIKISKPSSNWSFIANELLASYYLKNKDIDNAKQSLNYIIDSKDSSDFIKERAKTILEMIERNK
tara:strand:+ start:5055 stop:5696 length:642 start_codon:yes stop_codon:yes gene_type:complete